MNVHALLRTLRNGKQTISLVFGTNHWMWSIVWVRQLNFNRITVYNTKIACKQLNRCKFHVNSENCIHYDLDHWWKKNHTNAHRPFHYTCSKWQSEKQKMLAEKKNTKNGIDEINHHTGYIYSTLRIASVAFNIHISIHIYFCMNNKRIMCEVSVARQSTKHTLWLICSISHEIFMSFKETHTTSHSISKLLGFSVVLWLCSTFRYEHTDTQTYLQYIYRKIIYLTKWI